MLMYSYTMRSGVTSLVFAVLAGVVSGQQVRDSHFHLLRLDSPSTDELVLPANATTTNVDLEWRVKSVGTSVLRTMPFNRSGGIARIGTGSPPRFLVSGFNNTLGVGVLCKVRLDSSPSNGITIEETMFLSADPLRVLWTDQRIFLIDGTGEQVISAAWNGTAALPTTFTLVIDKTVDSWLEAPHMMNLHPASPDGVILQWENFGGGDGVAGLRIHSSGGQWLTATVPIVGVLPPLYTLTGSRTAIPALGPLTVQGPAGPFTILDAATGAPVASGVSPGPGQDVVVAIANEMIPGNPHFISGATGISGHFTPTVRYGVPTAAAGLIADTGLVPESEAYVGNSEFGVAFDLRRTDTNGSLVVPAALWISVRLPGDADPITWSGTTAFLTPMATADFNISFQDGRNKSPTGYFLPIPNDSTLAGTIVLGQFAALAPSGQGFVVSDVFGTTIHPAPDPALTAKTATRPAKLTPEQRKNAYNSVLKWMKQCMRKPKNGPTLYQLLKKLLR